jgi:hypothetical protein
MPYYLSIQLPVAVPGPHGFYDGWSILVDLKKASVLNVYALFVTEAGASQREQEIELQTFCGSGGSTSVLSQ